MKRVLLLLANGFEAVEASVFSDVIGWNEVEGDRSTTLTTVGLHPQLTCTFYFRVQPEKLLADIDVNDFDALAIPGGFEQAGFYDDAYSDAFLDVIRHFDAANKPIAAVCVAALPLGKSGILTNRRATTYNLNNGLRQQQLRDFGVNVIADEAIVIDRNVITSYNPSTSFDVAFQLLEKLTSKENTEAVRRLMGF